MSKMINMKFLPARKSRLIPFLFIFLFILNPGAGFTGESDFPLLKPADLSAGKIIETRFYRDKELFGYIDGGAEIYREYGFVGLAVQELRWNDQDVVVEIYRMKSPAAAFGIFSVTRRNCPPVEKLNRWSCSSPFQLIFCKGDFFVSITNYLGTPELQAASIELGQKIVRKIGRPEFIPPDILRTPLLRPYSGDLRLMLGRLGLQNGGYFRWVNFLKEIPQFAVYALPIQKDSALANITLFSVADSVSAQKIYAEISGINSPAFSTEWKILPGEELRRAVCFLNKQEVLYVEFAPNFPADFNRFLTDLHSP